MIEILELKNTITEEVSKVFKQNNAHKRRSRIVESRTRDNKLKLRRKKGRKYREKA